VTDYDDLAVKSLLPLQGVFYLWMDASNVANLLWLWHVSRREGSWSDICHCSYNPLVACCSQ